MSQKLKSVVDGLFHFVGTFGRPRHRRRRAVAPV